MLFLIGSSFYSFIPLNKKDVSFSFLTQDSITVDVFKIIDSDSILEGYRAFVFTPICEDDECYAVELNFYWDELGNFHKYEIIPGKPLTKREHEPFTKEEYAKLQNLLLKKETSFSSLKKEDLIQDVKEDSIDGYTGATIAAVKKEVIPGAVYSCFTLWHIAHGAVVDSIQNQLKSHLTAPLVSKIVSSENMDSYYLLINLLEESDFERYLEELLQMIRNSKGYFAKNAIETIPDGLIEMTDFQDSLSLVYSGLGYFAQLGLIKRLDQKLQSLLLLKAIVEGINANSSLQLDLILNLLLQSDEYKIAETFDILQKQFVQKMIRLKKDQQKKFRGLEKINRRYHRKSSKHKN